MQTLPATDLDLRDVAMVLAEEDMCRRFVGEFPTDATAEEVARFVAGRFGLGKRSDIIASFVWRGVQFAREIETFRALG